MGEIVIAIRRPKKGRGRALERILGGHVPLLRRRGFATRRAAVIMRAKDGTVLEVIEWKIARPADRAHRDHAVRETWGRLAAVSDHGRLADLAEAMGPFPHFHPLR